MAPAAVTLERHDTVGLAWSKAAILDSLQLARQALEQFAREPAEAAPLSEFVSQLHQVQGCLRVLELRGAAHLAEEMELLGAALAASAQPARGECLGALFRGLEQLPAYLERLRGARHDLPLVMLPLLNQLRHCRGLEPLAESSLNQAGAPAAAAADLADLDVSLGNWREQLQAGQGRDALRSVVIALCDDLIRIKERLDHFVRSDRHDASQMDTLLAPLRQIADTLAVLGFQQPRRVIIDQVLALQGLPAHNHAGADALLMDVAGALLYVEATLNGMVGPLEDNDPASLPGSDLLEIRQQVLSECQGVVQQARELIADCLDDDWSWQRLQGVPGLLQQARGALSMLMLAEAAEVLGGCAAYTQGWLNDLDQRPHAATLEPFAEALCAAEFYLQWQLADPLADARPLLQRACASLAVLGVPCQQRASTAVASEALDDGLREVFLEEAGELLAEIERQWSLWRAEQTSSALGELRRALHTLKGSGRMVHAEALAALAWGAEHLLNRVLDGRISLSRDGQAALQQVFVRLPDLIADYAGGQLASSAENQALADHLHALAQDQAAQVADTDGLDPHLLGVFAREAAGHLHALEAFLQLAGGSEAGISDALQRALHTLKGSAAMAGVEPMAQLATALDRLVREFKSYGVPLGAAQLQQLQAAHGLLQRGLAQLDSAPLAAIAGAGELIEQIEQSVQQALAQLSSAEQPAVRDPQATARLLGEAMDHVLEAEAALARWQAAPAQRDQLDGLLDELTALGHAAHLADLWSLDQLCESLLDLLGAVEEGSLAATDTLFELVAQGLEGMLDMLDEVAAGQDVEPRPALLARLHEHLHSALDPASLGLVGPQGVRPLELPASSDTAEGEIEAASELDEAPGDKALLEVFLEESSDIVESSATALARWQADPRNTAEVETLLRDLHTLKGGARMVEISAIGDLAHELEFLYELLAAGRLPPSLALFSLLQNCHDRLAHMLDAVRLEQPLHAATALIDYIRNFTSSALNDTVAGVLPSEAAPAEAPAATHERATGDMVKVDAELLDELGNLASEHSILRGRIEQQVNDGQFALNEMETTLERMRDQLLRLDNETQSRVLSRHQAEGDAYDDFDPLEMDRHSQLQQLSRALFESASDLLDLKETLAQRAQHTHGLLQQQARINSQLQEGLTATLMVPFERLVPRLQRVVRQVASELGKQVELVVGNAEGELDRSVLERMVAPLEHMLRNAVDHGLETSSARRAAGKPEQGTIHLGLLHEGADIVIEMSDDGAGVPLEAVRKKAIKRGLLDPEATLSDHEVLQFILRPGFSTAEKITQISGRGLGMDVVHEEVKQLGGSMSIESSPGKGARFQIRLPFTVSLNRALMVHLGEEQYAIGLNTIEGVVRVPPAELEACYRLDPPQYVYAGYQYQLRYLGELLQGTPQPNLLGQSVPLPVLLVHSQEQSFAIQVDGLSPSREIVVKSLGPQFAAVPGLAGATLLGDGRVVLILDLLGQLRGQQRRLARLPSAARSTPMLPGSSRQRSLLVMVVDDSVTVRKVTSRLLERHGMSVLTAKDGVDAMALLQEHCPDVLLLDIEMPRMDGFEVATRIRQDERLRHLPIIMITSRSGQKHRERAMAIGVNEYLGKPYQESQLLHSIAHWSAPHA
ncbi:hybrid sensor histidine kinase/response regulator [Pseudomonas cremoricolorata]|uniref:Chemotaxis protein CheA n=1 Tax=Pseudomonas cremoricolorata TaxID=157783 RepID=A0A089WMK2_9PSED|nr:Hpt domain-containing protein [Pseudomonas cremoricolorata]AIR88389.1 chemotaxis protein CheA [Pseudomonas cremoricolorata]